MPFEYVRPNSLEEAIRMLVEGGEDARPISGGQSLMPMVNLGLASPSLVVDLRGLPGLAGIEIDGGTNVVGAGTCHRDLVESPDLGVHAPLLVKAASHIGSARIRNMGTIGGSLAHGDPVAELPLAGLVLDAEYELQGPEGSRVCGADDFAQGYYMTDVREGEILTEVRIPSGLNGWGFEEYARRAGDFALAAAAVTVSMRGQVIEAARVAVAGASDRPIRLRSLEQSLVGADKTEAAQRVDTIAEQIEPTDDPHVTAAYRRRLIVSLTRRALASAVHRAEEELT